MHDPHIRGPLMHTRHELHQPLLIRMRRVTANAGDLHPNIDTLTVYIYIATFQTILLNGVTRRSLRLVTSEQHVVPSVVPSLVRPLAGEVGRFAEVCVLL